jgi:hypothetical protein
MTGRGPGVKNARTAEAEFMVLSFGERAVSRPLCELDA